MAVQINVNPDAPGFPQTVIPGQSVDVPSGSIVQFVDTETGQVIDPQTLGVTILPDGTLRVVFSDGTTFDLVGASPESLEPAAGPPPTGGGDAVGQGSSLAVALFFDDGFGNLFEAGQGGGFESLAGVGFLPPGADPNLLLLLAGGGPELLAAVVAGV
ncbi:MAG: hypothetical protein MI920_25190, partial [Kiloniellales bacterium]|nr:hypothetical protein [Kiloniellales bacterium]